MDIATVLGIVICFGMILSGIGGKNLPSFVDVASLLIVVGGTFGAVLINYPLSDVLSAIGVVKNTFFIKSSDPRKMIPELVGYSARVRKDGILALQSVIGSAKDEFLKKGLQLAVDGMEPQIIMKVLETEMNFTKDRHEFGAEIMTIFATFAPAFGMIGTLIGLVMMLQSMDDPSTIGPSMAVALITTFYGAVIANLFCLPLKGKLELNSAREMTKKELIIEGVIGIQGGDNPRMLRSKLETYLSPNERSQDEPKK